MLFQSLSEQVDALTNANADPQVVYERCLDHTHRVIEGGFSDPDIEESLTPLKQSVDWVMQGTIARREYHNRFVHYDVPADLCQWHARGRFARAAIQCGDNSDDVLFWPQARARWDREKVQLVSLETSEGWYYDLWYPSYLWAETPNSWRAPGLDFTSNSQYALSYAPLDAVAREFQGRESTDATWRVETDFGLVSSAIGRGYPVVLSVMNHDRPSTSSLTPDVVAGRLAEIYHEDTAR